MGTILRGTGMYVPGNVVDNDRLSMVMDTTDEWIRQRTGIVTRHFADLDQGTSDMAVPAAQDALRDAGVDPAAVDYVVFATMTPDYYFPGSGAVMQAKLGLPHAPCLDIRQQCAGFLFGLQLADSLLRCGQAETVLLVGAEVHGGFMPFRSWDVILGQSDGPVSDDEYTFNTRFRDRVVLFGDGAGACVVQRDDDAHGLIDLLIHTDGTLFDKMWVNGGGSKYRPYFSADMHHSGDIVPIVVGREVFRTAVTYMPQAVESIVERNGLTLDDIDLLIMHQANLRINEAVQQRLGLPDEKVYNNIQKYGNTTAATIPMAFHEAREACGLEPGDLVCFVALGSGLSWGAALYRM